ncbi:hypothetical protein [Archaeoglobus veneficus]|uniref:30S ribosomal protein S26e n=1 Tax=Archaeoglobus veneficus (strain DSM 11195 / SNP6) TaxID=693661 RepID=F2KNT9_ARCVS|nr:hypothetical protein [Archaeoglobus veneficus]AEA47416.1 hypothetical protein Arcve_1412 [Archaeoglobus veneficus SNP6]
MAKAPYVREYKQSKARGKDYTVRCDGCGRNVPRFKTFVSYRGLRLDYDIVRMVGKKNVHVSNIKAYYCPKCARNLGIVKIGKLGRRGA